MNMLRSRWWPIILLAQIRQTSARFIVYQVNVFTFSIKRSDGKCYQIIKQLEKRQCLIDLLSVNPIVRYIFIAQKDFLFI